MPEKNVTQKFNLLCCYCFLRLNVLVKNLVNTQTAIYLCYLINGQTNQTLISHKLDNELRQKFQQSSIKQKKVLRCAFTSSENDNQLQN